MSAMAEIKREFRAMQVDVPRLAEAFRDHVVTLAPAPDSVQARVKAEADDIVLVHDGLEGIITAPPAGPRDLSLSVAWYGETRRYLTLDLSPQDRTLRLYGDVPEAEIAKTRAALDAFAAASGLTQAPKRTENDRSPDVYLEQRYQRPNRPEGEVLDAFRDKICIPLGLDQIRGSLTTMGATRRRTRDVRTIQEIQSLLIAQEDWERLGLQARPKDEYRPTVHLDLDGGSLNRLNLTAEVGEDGAEPVDAAFSRFAEALALEPWVDLWEQERSFAVAERRFGWLDTTPNIAEALDGKLGEQGIRVIEWEGTVWRRRRQDPVYLEPVSTAAALTDALARLWSAADEIELRGRGSAGTIEVRLEPRLAVFSLRARAKDLSKAETVTTAVAASLGVAPDDPPLYDHAQLIREFAVPERWSGERFAREIEQSIRFRIANAPLVLEANVGAMDRNQVVQLTHYDNLETWLGRLRTPKPYSRAFIHVRGPRGRELSVALSDKRRRLELRAQMPADEFEEMVRLLKRQLRLDPAPEVAPAKGIIGRLLDTSTTPGKIAALIGFVVAGTAGFLAGEFRGRVVPDYSITLLAPPAGANGEARVEAGCVVVSWELRKTWILSGDAIDERGDVHVVPATGQLNIVVEQHTSGERVHLPPGRFRVFVRDPELGVRTEPLWVEATDDRYEERAERATKDCGPALTAPGA
ncbi:MAG: hypothetical protein U9Q81_00095 [Pseudomonadota bacterium]|nr:hypothetical protein [Pseudomonadota bacterium]